jgi:hypothetical protein
VEDTLARLVEMIELELGLRGWVNFREGDGAKGGESITMKCVSFSRKEDSVARF